MRLNEYSSKAIASANSLVYVLANNKRVYQLHQESSATFAFIQQTYV